MHLNKLSPGRGARKEGVRVGRGGGSGLGKTCGKGHKGQHARAGGYHKVGFEGGQMPLQRRLPKRGFRSAMAKLSAEVRLSDIAKLKADVIDLDLLRKENVVPAFTEKAKVYLCGKIERAVTIKGLGLTAGAKAAILEAGGQIES